MAQPWDPDRYLTYADERGRPFVELIARIPTPTPATVVDLGCGPGNLTRLLTDRWPGAKVTGVDSSPAMIQRARHEHDGIDWQLADVREWDGSADVVVSNATFQWVPDHLELLPRLAAGAREVFAFQVPGNFDEPSHALREELAAEEPYRRHTLDLQKPSSHDPATYLEVLEAEGFEVDAWETTYLHVLPGADAVFDWISGTSLLPTRAALPEDLFERFAARLKRRLRAAYPARNGQVVLPFRRVFVVGVRR
ncbi:methyltransferase domain-containing protein [Nocardioides sp. CER19]|uniref:methyltransferase domain-containing protein n=1 Tax=Nocardioides sp. CER19 TaxID=3038538 RepID=UPI0024473538|nr:methyltransferase domain-containing protein [Nocardioides sp. CER19]MDH2414695.1 methyltransferase domain-containing protein [Nocardioides sp. CER19]